jgi:branched-chain amino acid aminotransferase
MRMQIINLAIANGMKVYECNILPQNLLVADEIFLTNAVQGILWVGGYRTKRYFNNTSKLLIELLNKKWRSTD